jgi:hypothetical protein
MSIFFAVRATEKFTKVIIALKLGYISLDPEKRWLS